MPTRPSPERVRLLEVLADGEWHPREELLAAACRVIPPGKAWRNAENERLRQTPGKPRTRGDDQDAIAAGRRALARSCLTTLAKQGRLERDGDQVRLTPRETT